MKKTKSFCTCLNSTSWSRIDLNQVNFNSLFTTNSKVSHYLIGSNSEALLWKGMICIYLVILTQPYFITEACVWNSKRF